MHGQPRYTGDLNLWLRVTPGNVERVLRALADFRFGSVGLSAADFMQPEAVIQLGYPPGRIDLLTHVDGVDFDACFAKRIEVSVVGVVLPVIGLEDFKSNKRASGRAKDLADLEALRDEPDGS